MPPQQNNNPYNPFEQPNKEPQQDVPLSTPSAPQPQFPQNNDQLATAAQSHDQPAQAPAPSPFTQSNPYASQPEAPVTPPPQPQFAQPTQFQMTSFNQFATPPQNDSKRKVLIFSALAIAILAAIGAAVYFFVFSQKSPDDVFRSTLESSLSTSSLTQTTTAGTSRSKVTIDYDLRDVKNPKVSSDLSFNEAGASITLKGYGTFKNTYANIHEFTGLAEMPSAGKDKWIQIRKDGAVAEQASPLTTFYNFYDPNFVALGQYIYGNFSQADRKTLVDYATQQHVYEYDSKSVKSEQLDGKKVLVYRVKVSPEKFAAYNQKAGHLMGMSDAAIEESINLSALSNSLEATLYIDPKASQLIKVVVDQGGGSTTQYSKWNQVTLPTEPKPDYQYSDFLKLTASTPQSTPSSSIALRAADTERRADIQSLAVNIESYYAENGVYPTYQNINDSSWRAANLENASDSAFRDPNAQTNLLAGKPQPGSYAYEVGTGSEMKSCNNVDSDCTFYRLTATLSDGTSFTKDALF